MHNGVSNCVFFILQIKNPDYICSPQREKCSLNEEYRAISSVGLEHLPYKQGVVGSNPTSPTIINQGIKPRLYGRGFFILGRHPFITNVSFLLIYYFGRPFSSQFLI